MLKDWCQKKDSFGIRIRKGILYIPLKTLSEELPAIQLHDFTLNEITMIAIRKICVGSLSAAVRVAISADHWSICFGKETKSSCLSIIAQKAFKF